MDKAFVTEEALQPLTDIAEKQGWGCELLATHTVYFTNWSPAGEDIGFETNVKFTGDNLVEVLRDIIKILGDFDVDEHVEMWVPLRGTRGVPSSISVLLHDAEDIQEMYEALATSVAALCAEIIRKEK